MRSACQLCQPIGIPTFISISNMNVAAVVVVVKVVVVSKITKGLGIVQLGFIIVFLLFLLKERCRLFSFLSERR